MVINEVLSNFVHVPHAEQNEACVKQSKNQTNKLTCPTEMPTTKITIPITKMATI